LRDMIVAFPPSCASSSPWEVHVIAFEGNH
jgi:hypothetical protein